VGSERMGLGTPGQHDMRDRASALGSLLGLLEVAEVHEIAWI
jgi:hypothetical protein